jgi:hypothetical protein
MALLEPTPLEIVHGETAGTRPRRARMRQRMAIALIGCAVIVAGLAVLAMPSDAVPEIEVTPLAALSE